MTARVFDNRACMLGEGPLWHPKRKQLFWFNILDHKLLTVENGKPRHWTFDEPVSAAGWIDETSLLIASARGLWHFNLTDGTRELVTPLEENNPVTRSNDGRADPWGGFWIGTMGYTAEPAAGAIYRFYQGRLQKLFADITISNAICFSPDRARAYFTDTPTQRVMRIALDRNGWPDGDPEVFLDLSAEDLNPDGAVTDAQGTLWLAQWGASRVAAYAADGTFQQAISLPARHITCPAFGGDDLTTLYVTSAREGLDSATLAAEPDNGRTFAVRQVAQGVAEPRVLL